MREQAVTIVVLFTLMALVGFATTVAIGVVENILTAQHL